jgi:hypothetical protein
VVHPSAASLRPSFFWSISIVAAICYLTSFQIRTRRIDPALEKLPLDPSDSAALAAWRTGTLLADVTLESVLLFGVMLYVFGATAGQAAPFFCNPVFNDAVFCFRGGRSRASERRRDCVDLLLPDDHFELRGF